MGCGQPCDGFYCYLCTCQQCGVNLINGICLNCTYGDGKPVTCCGCEGPLNGGFCSFCASRAGNSFAYDPNPNSFDDSQNLSDYPPQPQYQTYSCELCGNDAHYGYDCPPQVPFVYNQDPCFNQNFDDFPQTSPSFPQQFLCCENCGGPHATFECQPMNQNFHDSNSSGFDQFQPPQFPVIHQPPQEMRMEALQAREDLMKSIQNFLKKFNRISFRETPKVLMQAWDKFFEVKHAQSEEVQELLNKLLQDLQSINEELAEYINTPSWNLPTSSYDDDDDDVEDLVHTPSESDGISEGECDLPVYDDSSLKKDEVLDDIISIPPRNSNDHFNVESSPSESMLNHDNVISSPKIDLFIEEFAGELALLAPISSGIVKANLDLKEDIRFIENLMYDNSFPLPPETLKDNSKTVIDSNNDYSSSDDDSYEYIDYVDASPLDSELASLEVVKIVILEVGGIDTDILLTIKDDILREKLLNVNLLIAKIEALKYNPTPSSDFVTKSSSTSPNFFLEETNTFDNSLPESETFCFNLEEKSSGSTTTHADFSQYDLFIFDLSINPFPPGFGFHYF
ncbi:hypothetical protein Tco_1059552 [Tanacetum coccineum]